jgi:hypothetical protein
MPKNCREFLAAFLGFAAGCCRSEQSRGLEGGFGLWLPPSNATLAEGWAALNTALAALNTALVNLSDHNNSPQSGYTIYRHQNPAAWLRPMGQPGSRIVRC